MKIIHLNCGVTSYMKVLAVIDATFTVVKRKPKKIHRLVRDSNPCPL